MTTDRHDKLQTWEAREIEGYSPGLAMPLGEPAPADGREYAALLVRRKWLMAATFLVVFGLGMLYTFTRRPIYESSAKVVVATTVSTNPVNEEDVPLLSDLRALTRSRSVDTQVDLISSPELLEEAFGALGPAVRARGFGSSKLPKWAARVAARKNTDIVVVTGRAYTPAAAAALANTIVNLYFKHDLERNNQATRQARRYAGEQMATAEKELAYASADLASYKRRTGLYAPEQQLAKAAEQTVELSMQLDAAKAQHEAERRQVAAMRRELSGEKTNVTTATTVGPNPQYDAALRRLDELNSQRATLLQEFTPESREVRDMDERIRLEKERLKGITASIVASRVQARNPVRDSLAPTYANLAASAAASEARIRSLEAALAEKRADAQSLPERERGLAERVQRVAMLQHTYETLSNKYNALLLSEQATLPTGMLVASARSADRPAYPSRGKNAVLFILTGMLFAVGLAIVVDKLDRRIYDEEATEEMTHLPSLSIVPKVAGGSPLLIAGGGNSAAMLESFRILRNSIASRGRERELRTIAVTSPGRQEGKSTTSINLAVAISMEGKRVLLVDADMRRPSLHKLTGVHNSIGLSTVLAGKTNASQAISATRSPNVFCLPAGPIPSNASEMLNSQASRELFRRLAQEFDSVVVDCPPTVGLSDVQVISTLVDGVLLVVSMSQTLKPQLSMTTKLLRQSGAPLVGVVLNRMDTHHWGYGYYDYCEPQEPEAEVIKPSI